MRQRWLTEVVPYCEQVGIDIPAHFEKEKNEYVLDYEMPILLNEETGEWDYTTVTWEEKFNQWRKGGRNKVAALERLQGECWGKEFW